MNHFNTSINVKLAPKRDSSNKRVKVHPIFNDELVWPFNVELCITRFPIREREKYTPEMCRMFAEKLKSSMINNGIVFLVCYAPTEKRSRPFEVASIMEEAGFNHIDNIIIEKSWFSGKRDERCLSNSHDYVFWFCNGDVWKLDRLPVKEYLIENGFLDAATSNACIGNTWKVKTGSLEEKIPKDLASLLFKVPNVLPGSLVFDPFGGSKSTLMCAIENGHSFFSFEQSESKLNKYNKIIRELEIK
jgi:DNA modification methylase